MPPFDPTFSPTAVPAALSVGGLVDYIKAVLEDDPTLNRVWVVGEVSSAKPHAKGLFFTLTDSDTGAAINCVAWKSAQMKLTTQPAVGDQVIALGSVKVYPQRSSYQLTVAQVLPGGDGLKALRYRQLRQRLAAEGLFDAEYKRPLPALPQTIAVVSSPQAAAWGDIQRSLRQHHPGLHILFSPAVVQGDSAPDSIAAAIARAVADGRAEVLILARGGGASEDLECFDDERVVRAVADCPIPVVTGIGHQRDESLADLAADLAAHTPTAAAIAAVPALADLLEAHRQRTHHLTALVTDRLAKAQTDRHRLSQRLLRVRLDQRMLQQRQHLQQLQRRLVQGVQVQLRQASDRTQALRSHLMTLDPDTVVRRGYALVRDDTGNLVTRADRLALGQTLQVQLAQGQLTVTVTHVHPPPP